MSNDTNPSTNEQSDNGRNEAIELGVDTIDMRLVTLERLVAAIINSIDQIKIQDTPVESKHPLASRDISRDNRINAIEIRLDGFYESLNFLNRFQSQLDGIVDRIDAIERSLENPLNENVESKFYAVSSTYSRLVEQTDSIEARLSSVEHTVLNFVSPRRFVAAVKRNILRRFGKSV